MRNIIFLNRFFFPDHSATSQILSDLAFQLAADGRPVHVITSRQKYDDARAELPPFELVDGVTVHRIRTTRFGRGGIVGRAIDYLSFYTAAYKEILRTSRPGDLLIAKTDPPLLSILGANAARKRQLALINWLQDLYPEIASELGVPFVRGPQLRALIAARNRSLKSADATIVLGTSMANRLLAAGVDRNRIHIIPNWTDDAAIVPVDRAENPLIEQWKLQDKFVVGYSGNLGRAHEFETILAAADRLRGDAGIVFLFLGGGKHLCELKQRVGEMRLDDLFRFMPYQSQETLKYSLSVPQVHWISLRPEVEGLIFPSKFYGIAAAGRAMISISALDGELAGLVRQFNCGVAVAPGDASALVEAIANLRANPRELEAMGKRARTMLELDFSRAMAYTRWRNMLAAVQ